MTIKHTSRLISIRNILTLRYDPEKLTSEKKLNYRDFKPLNDRGDASDSIESILKNQIKLQIGKAENVAVPIGSGVDSAVIMSLAKEVFPDKNIFGISLGFGDSQDETNDAKRICSALGTDCHTLPIKNVLQDLPLLISIVAEPRWNLWYYYVLKYATKLGAQIMLTGDGGDELFAGYIFRYSKYLSLIEKDSQLPISVPSYDVKWVRKVWSYLQCHDRDWVPDQTRMFGSKISNLFDWYAIMRYFKSYFDKTTVDANLNAVFLADYNGKLIYDWIPTNYKLTRYFGIQTSSPFLTDVLLEYAPHIPIEQKYDIENQVGKLVLRKILEKQGVLNLISKKKLGFGMDLVNLWENYGREIASEYLNDPVICKEQLIDRAWLAQTINNLKKNKDPRYINKVLQLLSLEIWYRMFIVKDISQTTKLV